MGTRDSTTTSLYAHTSIQLFNQVQRDGYTGEDLRRIVAAHTLAARVFACRVQPSGEEYITHVIGTASVLSATGAPSTVVAAGLLHNVYEKGDFGDARWGPTRRRRRAVREAVGLESEELVYEFMRSNVWSVETIVAFPATLDDCGSVCCDVLRLRIADLLENYRDLAQLYGGHEVRARARIRQIGDSWIQLAELLVGAELAAELRHVFDETMSIEIPQQLRQPTGQSMSFIVVPESYRRRRIIVLREGIARGRHFVRRCFAALYCRIIPAPRS